MAWLCERQLLSHHVYLPYKTGQSDTIPLIYVIWWDLESFCLAVLDLWKKTLQLRLAQPCKLLNELWNHPPHPRKLWNKSNCIYLVWYLFQLVNILFLHYIYWFCFVLGTMLICVLSRDGVECRQSYKYNF